MMERMGFRPRMSMGRRLMGRFPMARQRTGTLSGLMGRLMPVKARRRSLMERMGMGRRPMSGRLSMPGHRTSARPAGAWRRWILQ